MRFLLSYHQNYYPMKKVVTTALVSIIAITNLNAQSLDIGLGAGLGISNINITNSSNIQTKNYSPLMSYNFNGYLSYKSKGLWGFSLEPGVIRKGWNITKDAEKFESMIGLHYLQLPALSNFYLSDKFYFSFGPEVSYLLRAKSKFKNNNNSGTQDLKRYLSKFELCALVAINYKINDNFDVGCRYSHALTEVADGILWGDYDGNAGNFIESNEYNHYFQLLLKMKIKNIQ